MKKLFLSFFLLSFLISLKGFIISFIFLIIVIISFSSLLFYRISKNKKNFNLVVLTFLCIVGIFSGTVWLFFYTKYNAKIIVQNINNFQVKYKKLPQQIENITNNKNVVYHFVKNRNKEYYFLYYYVNKEYKHEYDGNRNIWFYSR